MKSVVSDKLMDRSAKYLKNMVGAPRFELGTSCAQGRRATRLRYAPTVTALFILKQFPTLLQSKRPLKSSTVHELCTNEGYCTVTVHNGAASNASVGGVPISFARRLSFSSASRFICSFICEYFLKTCASLCRSICVTHSSARPPALSLVAYVERRS